ncbi:hypothetical protein AB0G00_24150 [Nocardia salmonicida]|uniref:hypothetical protein n=1 Tax=Nocardia salmonicida TaxID=53431 RepID=UPI0033DEC32D
MQIKATHKKTGHTGLILDEMHGEYWFEQDYNRNGTVSGWFSPSELDIPEVNAPASEDYQPHTKAEHTARCTEDNCESFLEHFNDRIVPGHPLAWSWYYDMIESNNAMAVAGGEWNYCWR